MSDKPHIDKVVYDISAPVLDHDQIEMLFMADDGGDSNSLALELFTLYKDEAEPKLAQLEQICQDRDADALRKVVHFIAGSAGNIGIMRFSLFCRGIEVAIDQGLLEDFDACARLIPEQFGLSNKAYAESLGL
ncbi:MAG: Hpt domain-containing protein [Opitutales bacterium]